MNTALITIFTIVGVALCGPLGRPGPCGGGGPGGPSPPPFLRNVTDEARKEYLGITHNTNETIAQQKQEIQAWGQKYGVSDQIQEFNVNATKMKAEVQQNVTNLINSLPTIMQQFLAINNNEDQTRVQQVEMLGKLSASNPPSYSVLRFAMDQFSPRHGMGNKGGMMGGHGGCGGPGGKGMGSKGGMGVTGSKGGMGGMGGFADGFGQSRFGGEEIEVSVEVVESDGSGTKAVHPDNREISAFDVRAKMK